MFVKVENSLLFLFVVADALASPQGRPSSTPISTISEKVSTEGGIFLPEYRWDQWHTPSGQQVSSPDRQSSLPEQAQTLSGDRQWLDSYDGCILGQYYTPLMQFPPAATTPVPRQSQRQTPPTRPDHRALLSKVTGKTSSGASQVKGSALPPFDDPMRSGCGLIAKYFKDTQRAWQRVRTNEWLQSYREAKGNERHFAGVLTEDFLGLSSRCSINEDCDFNPCMPGQLSNQECNLQPAFHVLRALKNSQLFFRSVADVIQGMMLRVSLVKDDFAITFYTDENVRDFGQIKSVLNNIAFWLGAFSFTGPQMRWVERFGVLTFAPSHAANTLNTFTLGQLVPA